MTYQQNESELFRHINNENAVDTLCVQVLVYCKTFLYKTTENRKYHLLRDGCNNKIDADNAASLKEVCANFCELLQQIFFPTLCYIFIFIHHIW